MTALTQEQATEYKAAQYRKQAESILKRGDKDSKKEAARLEFLALYTEQN